MLKVEECLCSAQYPTLMQNGLESSWLRLLVRGFVGGGFTYTLADSEWEVINSCCPSEMVIDRNTSRNVVSSGILVKRNLCSTSKFTAIEESRAVRDGWNETEKLVLNGRANALGLTTSPETLIQSVTGVSGLDAVLVNASIFASSYGNPIVIFSRAAWGIYQTSTQAISFANLSASLAHHVGEQIGAGLKIVISDRLAGNQVIITHRGVNFHLTQFQFDGYLWNEVSSVLDNSTPFPLTSTRNISAVAEAIMQYGGVSDVTGTTLVKIN